jgi:hypothetical protein
MTTNKTPFSTRSGNGNGKVQPTAAKAGKQEASAKARSAKTASAARRTAATTGSIEEQAEELLSLVRNTIHKSFGVKLQTRDKRLVTKVGHATKEKIGLDIAAQLKKRGGKMDWQKWNNRVFPRLFGQPDALKYDLKVIALMMAHLYDVFDLDPTEAIKGLVKFNQDSLTKRNNYKVEQEEEDDEPIDEDEDFDEEEDELDDLDSEESEESDDDDELLDVEDGSEEDDESEEDDDELD